MIYSKIKELEALGFSQRNIAKQLGISRNTVTKYRDKDVEMFTTWLASTKHRKQKLDEHKERILDWLRTYPNLTTAQIQDWLEERGFENIVESTLRRYVKNLREEYQLPKQVHQRKYEAIPDPPMGEQDQIDFGQIWVTTENKQRIKLYVVAFVLSHSRYKYMEWWDHPFINEIYENTSIILTSNKSPNDWGQLIGDEIITGAILDRIIQRSEIIQLSGDSFRLKHREGIFEQKKKQKKVAQN
ncbi:ATP-binding protein [Listeria valentina]|uniref:ATP-binding protein n=1 Tax=Listeria valentina TaxID=2705293 RepID=UPI0014305D6E|nr:ATP-binding protein [Listeria valentina]